MADAFKSHVKIFALNGINKNEDVCSSRQKKNSSKLDDALFNN